MRYFIIGLFAGGVLLWLILGGVNACNHNNANSNESVFRSDNYRPDTGQQYLAEIIKRNGASRNRVNRIERITGSIRENDRDIGTKLNEVKSIYSTNKHGIERIEEGLDSLKSGLTEFKKLMEIDYSKTKDN